MRNRICYTLLLLFVFSASCTKMKYSSFAIASIELLELNAATVNTPPRLYFDCQGPGMSNVTDQQTYSYPDYSLTFACNFKGKRGSADYTVKLMEDTDQADTEVTSIEIDFGKYKGQEQFTITNANIQVRFKVNWDSRW